MPARLDDIDCNILRELQDEGRITNVELARRVGISAPPCLRRVRALEEAGYIKSYRALLDEKLLGFRGHGVRHGPPVEPGRGRPHRVRTLQWAQPLVCANAGCCRARSTSFLNSVAPDLKTFQAFVITTAAPHVQRQDLAHAAHSRTRPRCRWSDPRRAVRPTPRLTHAGRIAHPGRSNAIEFAAAVQRMMPPDRQQGPATVHSRRPWRAIWCRRTIRGAAALGAAGAFASPLARRRATAAGRGCRRAASSSSPMRM